MSMLLGCCCGPDYGPCGKLYLPRGSDCTAVRVTGSAPIANPPNNTYRLASFQDVGTPFPLALTGTGQDLWYRSPQWDWNAILTEDFITPPELATWDQVLPLAWTPSNTVCTKQACETKRTHYEIATPHGPAPPASFQLVFNPVPIIHNVSDIYASEVQGIGPSVSNRTISERFSAETFTQDAREALLTLWFQWTQCLTFANGTLTASASNLTWGGAGKRFYHYYSAEVTDIEILEVIPGAPQDVTLVAATVDYTFDRIVVSDDLELSPIYSYFIPFFPSGTSPDYFSVSQSYSGWRTTGWSFALGDLTATQQACA